MTTVTMLFKFFLWENKLRKTIPELNLLKKFIFREIDILSKISKDFNSSRILSGVNFNNERIF
jgi:hypothetical protein